MIDYEEKIFNRVHAAVAPLCAKNHFVSRQTVQPTAFPAASLIEMSNVTVRNRQTSTPIENYARLTYQLDVYAMKKRDCRNVFAKADEAMISMNFTRVSGQYIDNAGNPDVFRYTARYEATADADGTLYRT